MPLHLPARPTSGPTEPPTPASGDRTPMPVLLLADPGVAAAVQGVLDAAPRAVGLVRTGTLSEAMIAVANRPPALALVDAGLCEGLEREFLDHLLRTHTNTRVLLLGADPGGPWPRHPRLTLVPAQALVPAVEAGLSAAAGLRGVV